MEKDLYTHDPMVALGSIASGCFVLTLPEQTAGPRAILLSFVQQVGFDPPRIVAAIHKERAIVASLDGVNRFVLNVCAQDGDLLLPRFARPEEGAGALEELTDQAGPAGVVLKTAAAYLTCAVVDRVDAGDHWLYLADVLDGARIVTRAPRVRVRNSGLEY